VVHVICVLSNPTPPPPVGGTTMQLTTDCADEAMQVASGEQVEGANELHNNVAGDSVRVLLCFIKPILWNHYGQRVSWRASQGGRTQDPRSRTSLLTLSPLG